MKVVVNHKEVELQDQSLLVDLISQMNMPEKGIAIAIDNQVIPKTNWPTFELKQEMKITLIKATQGG